jgi:putative flavoprotein involved in K+ transport
MTTQHIETLIIGAGQAGLSTGHHLQRQGRPVLIVDGNERIGDN